LDGEREARLQFVLFTLKTLTGSSIWQREHP
jgi:hypothetical protein